MEPLTLDPFWTRLGLLLGATCTLAMFSFLWRENAVYRFFEHIFVGLGMGYTVAITWTNVLKPHWWDKRVWMGSSEEILPFWGLLGIVGLLWYFQLSKKRVWLSRIPIGILMGSGAGLIFRRIYGLFFTRDGQVTQSFLPLWVSTDPGRAIQEWKLALGVLGLGLVAFYSHLHLRRYRRGTDIPAGIEIRLLSGIFLALMGAAFLMPRGLIIAYDNFLIVLTLVCVLCYFLFWEGGRTRLASSAANLGKWLLMISFGATFGSTVMARLSLLINRAQYLLEQCLHLK